MDAKHLNPTYRVHIECVTHTVTKYESRKYCMYFVVCIVRWTDSSQCFVMCKEALITHYYYLSYIVYRHISSSVFVLKLK